VPTSPTTAPNPAFLHKTHTAPALRIDARGGKIRAFELPRMVMTVLPGAIMAAQRKRSR
jgi:hypothetical protein